MKKLSKSEIIRTPEELAEEEKHREILANGQRGHRAAGARWTRGTHENRQTGVVAYDQFGNGWIQWYKVGDNIREFEFLDVTPLP